MNFPLPARRGCTFCPRSRSATPPGARSSTSAMGGQRRVGVRYRPLPPRWSDCLEAPFSWGRPTAMAAANRGGGGARGAPSRVLDRPLRRLEHAVRRVCGSHPLRDGSRALRLVLRLRRAACSATTAPPPARAVRAVVAASVRRRLVPPEGAQSNLAGRADHPVVRVSGTMPARIVVWARQCVCPPRPSGSMRRAGRLSAAPVSPGATSLCPTDEHRMNVWQGNFPSASIPAQDGYFRKAHTSQCIPAEWERAFTT